MAVSAGPASTTTCPIDQRVSDEGAPVAKIDAKTRVDFIHDRVELGGHRARQWTLGWGISFAILSLGQFGLVPLVKSHERADYFVGGTASAIGALTRFILRPKSMKQRRRLRRSTAKPGSCEALAEAEDALYISAKSEKFGRALYQHFLAIGFNIGVGLTLGLGFDRPISGNRIAVTGITLSQIMLITQPKVMEPALDAYRRGNVYLPPKKAAVRSYPMVLRRGAGLGFTGRF